jgi:hypothetical protein
MSYSSRRFKPNPPASPQAITDLNAALTRTLPGDYVAFLEKANGGEGFVGQRYLQLWRAENLIEFNKGYGLCEVSPTFFLIGSDGGGEGYVFDLSFGNSAVFEIPFITVDPKEARRVSDSFASFVDRIKI